MSHGAPSFSYLPQLHSSPSLTLRYMGVAPSAHILHQQLAFILSSVQALHTVKQSALDRTDPGIQVSSSLCRSQKDHDLSGNIRCQVFAVCSQRGQRSPTGWTQPLAYGLLIPQKEDRASSLIWGTQCKMKMQDNLVQQH